MGVASRGWSALGGLIGLGRMSFRLILAVLALLLGLVVPAHAGPPVVQPPEVVLPAAPEQQPSVVRIYFIAYRSQAPPGLLLVVRATSSRSAWCIQ